VQAIHDPMPAPRTAAAEHRTMPRSRSELRDWVRAQLRLPRDQEAALLEAIDGAFRQHETWWRQSKDDGIRAVSDSLGRRVTRLRHELDARQTAVSGIVRYFEDLVADLTDRAHRDPKTRLLNFRAFVERLETFLAVEQRGRWCAVGLVDIHSFKKHNDTLGHLAGDLIIDRVAAILREQVRCGDLVAQEMEQYGTESGMHARFGGDEFCFLIPELAAPDDAAVIARRFRLAVEQYPWQLVEPGLASQPVTVDVGVACLLLESAGRRRPIARKMALDLVALADKLMYSAKTSGTGFSDVRRVRLAGEGLDPIEAPGGPD